jgi:phosphomannomutase
MPDIKAAVERVIASPPTAVAGRAVTSIDTPASDILVLHLAGDSRVVIRPSGTEPKLKTYLQVVLDGFDDFADARAHANGELDELQAGVIEVLGLGD